MLFGDVLAAISGVLAITLTAWASMLAASLLFDAPVGAGQATLNRSLWRPMLGGLLLLGLFGGLGIALLNAPSPAVKILGMLSLGFVLTLGALGGASLSRYLATRMRMQHPGLEEFSAISRSSLVVIGASLLPLVGWFVFLPALLGMSIGAGWSSVIRRKSSTSAVEISA